MEREGWKVMKRAERAGIRATKGKGIGRAGKEEKEERIMGRERIKTRMARRRQGKGRTRSNPRKKSEYTSILRGLPSQVS
jgi:hypothetical protein